MGRARPPDRGVLPLTTPAADTPPHACYRCGAHDDLVQDEHVEDVWICHPCLTRVEAQNELIRRGLEEEPDVEM